MPYTSIEQAKAAGFNTTMDGVALTLSQVNSIAEQFDAIKKQGGVDEPMAVAVSSFKKSHTKTETGWKSKAAESSDTKRYRFYEACDVGVTVLEEAAAEGAATSPRLEVTVIREGFSKNTHREFDTRRHKFRRYYTAKAVADVAESLDGKSAYVGPTDYHGGERTLKDSVVGVFQNSRVEESGGLKVARAEIKIYPHQIWIADMARANPRAFGPSIEADGDVRKGVMEGCDAAIVESVTDLGGAMLVENPAAGGAVGRILESTQPQTTRRGERRMFKELTEAEQAEVLAEARKLVEAEVDYKAKDEKIKALEESVKKLEDDKKAAAATLAEAKSREILEAAFPKDLPDIAKNRLYEACKGETDKAKIEEAVKSEAAYIAALAGGTVVAGASGRTDNHTVKGELQEAEAGISEGLGLTPKKEGGK